MNMNNKMKNILFGAVGGAAIGTVYGGASMVAAVTAPISYPGLWAMAVATQPNLAPHIKVLLTPVAMAFGAVQVPLAPINFLFAPTYPFVGAALGATLCALFPPKG